MTTSFLNDEAVGILQCTLCKRPLVRERGSLRCAAGHCFDIAAKGYVNFVLSRKSSQGYDAGSYLHRQRFMRAGFYDHILAGVEAALSGTSGTLVDAGCGEGYLTHRLQQAVDMQVWGLDYQKESILLATAQSKQMGWLVADLAHMPFQDGSAQAILNAFAPANYAEFARVLKPGGLLLKVIPGPAHLAQIREAASAQLRGQAYDPARVAQHFGRHAEPLGEQTFSRTLPLDEEALEDLLGMTPLLFAADRENIDRAGIREVTIEGVLLMGRATPHRQS